MTTPPFPPFPPPPFPPDDDGRGDGLRRARNWIIGIICVLTVGALATTCAIDGGFRGRDARAYVQKTYQRNAALDEGNVVAYVANADPKSVSDAITTEERPTDRRTGATQVGNIAGSTFLQYPDYLIGVFPYGADKSRVMVSKDYRTGYNHYHSYVGSYWVPTPHYSGRGNSYRGGGSGAGK
ncbi:DUF4247 domain-containing protein [Gordonia crocea]|uniref:DUF4247 domain-containing protein n=1 Tax=Gordonia crocea TaxID=589162 RepID=A0A7I9UVJ8_9ACTN|nr:DUF4247 domain-containing protein [Gordonia crocea]GED97244.1 hypothetical protein nbrc107697_12830 [Gordonia crocea]